MMVVAKKGGEETREETCVRERRGREEAVRGSIAVEIERSIGEGEYKGARAKEREGEGGRKDRRGIYLSAAA